MARPSLFLLALLVAGCESSTLSCGDGEEPHVVTGLSGLYQDLPAVEVQLRVPEDCTVLDTQWMFWMEDTDEVRIDEAPTEGTIERDGIEAGDEIIAFSDLNLGVRLEYPDGEVGPEVALVWFSSGVDLVTVDCAESAEELGTLACAVRAP